MLNSGAQFGHDSDSIEDRIGADHSDSRNYGGGKRWKTQRCYLHLVVCCKCSNSFCNNLRLGVLQI